MLRIAALPRFATLIRDWTVAVDGLRIAALPRFATLNDGSQVQVGRLRIAALPRFATLDGRAPDAEADAADCGPSSVCYTGAAESIGP